MFLSQFFFFDSFKIIALQIYIQTKHPNTPDATNNSHSTISTQRSFEYDLDAQEILINLMKKPPFIPEDTKVFRYLCVSIAPDVLRPASAAAMRNSQSGTSSRPSSAASLSSTISSISQECETPMFVP